MDRLAQVALSPSPECPSRPHPPLSVTAAVAGLPPVGEEEESSTLSSSLWECCPGWGGGGKGPDALPGAVDCSDRRLPRPRNPPGAERAAPGRIGLLSPATVDVFICAHPSP